MVGHRRRSIKTCPARHAASGDRAPARAASPTPAASRAPATAAAAAASAVAADRCRSARSRWPRRAALGATARRAPARARGPPARARTGDGADRAAARRRGHAGRARAPLPGLRRRRPATCGRCAWRATAAASATAAGRRPPGAAARARAPGSACAGGCARCGRCRRDPLTDRPPGRPNIEAMHEVYDLFRRGTELLEAGHWHQAAIPLTKARDLAPEQASIREALGRVLFHIQQYEQAAREFQAVIDRAPTNDYALFCLGRSPAAAGPPRRGAPPAGARRLPAAGAPRLPRVPRPRPGPRRRVAPPIALRSRRGPTPVRHPRVGPSVLTSKNSFRPGAFPVAGPESGRTPAFFMS